MRGAAWAFALLALTAGRDALRTPPRPLAKTATLDLYVVSAASGPSTRPATDPATGASVFLSTPAILSAADVATVRRPEDSRGQPSLEVTLTPAGAKKLAAATANPAGMQIAVVANGTVVAVPRVSSPLSTTFLVTGGMIARDGKQLFEALTNE